MDAFLAFFNLLKNVRCEVFMIFFIFLSLQLKFYYTALLILFCIEYYLRTAVPPPPLLPSCHQRYRLKRGVFCHSSSLKSLFLETNFKIGYLGEGERGGKL